MTYDLIIIGSGPGGYSAAVRAGQYGLKTAIVEKDPKLGGACLHVGCIPTKALLHSADVWDYLKHPEEHGMRCDNPQLDFKAVNDRKNKIVAKHAKGVEGLMKKNKVEWIEGYGRLKGKGQVEVTSEKGTETFDAKNVILGTGAVGVEFASIFNRFGTKVTVLEMLPRLVPVEDEEVSKELERHFKKTGIRCETGARAENI